jgi:hypothetical protein
MAVVPDTEWLLRVIVGKTFSARYYPVPPFIPERFEPLTDLVKTWDFRRIWAEVGANHGRDGGLSEYRATGLGESFRAAQPASQQRVRAGGDPKAAACSASAGTMSTQTHVAQAILRAAFTLV